MADLKLAAVFSDNCVLQRGKSIALFGTGREGTAVEAVLSGKVLGTEEEQTVKGRGAVKDGRFEFLLPPLREGLEHRLTVTDDRDTVVLENIAIGEVWLAGGQSNMELELQNCAEKEALNRPGDTMLRFYYTQKRAYMDEEFFRAEENTGWDCFGGPGTKAWSAVGYFFGEKLRSKLQVPVGIIGCNWGGTSASAWIPREALTQDRDLQVYLDVYEEAVGLNDPCRPCGLYECMLKRVMPYTLKGFIYYQGESDDHLPHLYYRLFSRLIRQWREDWRDDGLPFLFVQLPMHRYKQDPDFKHWCLIREAQDRVYRTVRNTGMACAIDQGEFNEIHPKRKSVVGERLYLQALEVAYGMDCPEARGPRFAWSEPREGELILHFTDVRDGFLAGPDIPESERPEGTDDVLFEVAGADGAYVPVDQWLEQETPEGTVLRLRSAKVPDPVFARYLWTNYSSGNLLYGKNRIPLAPFRTSMRDGFVIGS